MKIKFGTNRLVIVTKKNAYKIALHSRGVAANYMEWINSCENPKVAKTEMHWYGLKQEALTDITVYPYKANEASIAKEHKDLYKSMKHNRLQVGKDSTGTWKMFDCEDIKYYTDRRK